MSTLQPVGHVASCDMPQDAALPPSPATAFTEDLIVEALPPTPPPARVCDPMIAALTLEGSPQPSPVGRVLTRYEALRHLVPQLRAWVRRPAEAQRFFAQSPWPPLDPVGAGVLVGLSHTALAVVVGSARGAKKIKASRRVALAAAVHAGLLQAPSLAPYATALSEAGAAATSACRTSPTSMLAQVAICYLSLARDHRIEAPEDDRLMMRVAQAVTSGAVLALPYRPHKPVPPTPPMQVALEATSHDAATRLGDIHEAMLCFMQTYNREEWGEALVVGMRRALYRSVAEPALLWHLTAAPPLPEGDDFLCGALIGTLFLGLFHGLKDIRARQTRRTSDALRLHRSFVVERFIDGVRALPSAIEPRHWDNIQTMLQQSIVDNVDALELRVRMGAYIALVEEELKQQQATDDNRAPQQLEQWRGVHWRSIRYPVVSLTA